MRHTILLLFLAINLVGCFKDYEEDFLYRDFTVEFDAATWQSKAPGKTYPILGPFEKGIGVQKFKVNLLGAQKPSDQTVQYRLVPEESTAKEGMHFSFADGGHFTIPANSNVGELSIDVLDFPPGAGNVVLVLELTSSEEVKVSENYKRIGISISLTGKPSENYPLHTQIGEGSFYNTIAIDIMQPGLPQDFKDRWNAMKANLLAFSTGGRTPYGLQVRFGANNKARVTMVYATTAALSFSYAYASWIYDLQLNDQGVGKFVFAENADGNATNLRGAGVMAPLLENWLEQYDFKVDWVDDAISTPRDGAQIGGFFKANDPASFVFGELTYIDYASNTPRPMPTAPAVYSLFKNNNTYYSSVLINPDDAGQSQAFKDIWAAAKAYNITNNAGRQLNQFLINFDPQFNDMILTMAYANAANTSKLIGQTRYWIRMSHNAELSFEYIYKNANAGVASPPQLFDNYLHAKKFKVTRDGNNLVFTDTNDPASFFIGSLGDLAMAATSFSWWF
jgi:hypothetical protein